MPLRNLSFFGLLLCLTPIAGLADQYIDVRIVNDSQYDQRIEVVDNICHLIVLQKRIVAGGAIPAVICSRGIEKGDVTIRNLVTGSEQRYPNVSDGEYLRAP